jgi:hypothetical protein
MTSTSESTIVLGTSVGYVLRQAELDLFPEQVCGASSS